MKYPDEENNQPPENKGAENPPENAPAAHESLPGNEFSTAETLEEKHIPSFPMDDSLGKPEFDFSSSQNSPEQELLPADEPARPATPAPRRRRRQGRLITRPDASEIGQFLESMAHRAVPTFDFFVFSMLAGGILGLGYLLDAPALLLLGILVAPILAPWIGSALAAAIGEGRFFGQTGGGFFTAALMIFFTGILAGLASRIWMPHTFIQAFLHSRLWVPDLLVLIVGTIVMTIAFIQSDEKPFIASIMVAYELFLPISAAGFGLGSGVEGLWPQSLRVALIHLAISMVLALIVFYYMGFRPLEATGYILAVLIVVVGLAITAGFAGIDALINVRGDQATQQPTATITLTTAPVRIIATVTPVHLDTAATPSSSPTFLPTLPPTPTRPLVTLTPVATFPSPTIVPTPVYGQVQSKGDGAVIRTEPGGSAITTVQNGYLVEILPEAPVVFNGDIWVHVIIKTESRDLNGWVLYNLIVTATPAVASP
jgi:hypothetical protein